MSAPPASKPAAHTRAQVPLQALLWKSWTHAQASGLGGSAECAVQGVQLSLLSVALYVLLEHGVHICVEKR
jgi:hypothetical protein